MKEVENKEVENKEVENKEVENIWCKLPVLARKIHVWAGFLLMIFAIVRKPPAAQAVLPPPTSIQSRYVIKSSEGASAYNRPPSISNYSPKGFGSAAATSADNINKVLSQGKIRGEKERIKEVVQAQESKASLLNLPDIKTWSHFGDSKSFLTSPIAVFGKELLYPLSKEISGGKNALGGSLLPIQHVSRSQRIGTRIFRPLYLENGDKRIDIITKNNIPWLTNNMHGRVVPLSSVLLRFTHNEIPDYIEPTQRADWVEKNKMLDWTEKENLKSLSGNSFNTRFLYGTLEKIDRDQFETSLRNQEYEAQILKDYISDTRQKRLEYLNASYWSINKADQEFTTASLQSMENMVRRLPEQNLQRQNEGENRPP